MKFGRTIFLALAVTTSGTADELSVSEIPYGVEVLTGYRSSYVDRGFRLSQDLIEVQLASELALTNEWVLVWGGWYGSVTGDGDFEQASGFLGMRHDAGEWSGGLDARWNSYDHPVFDDGLEVGPTVDWSPSRDWRVGGKVAYDTGAGGFYGYLEAEWSPVTGENSYLSILTSLGIASDFYASSGLHDATARVGWTYQINQHIAVTPFVGGSVGLDSVVPDTLFSGVWFAVNF